MAFAFAFVASPDFASPLLPVGFSFCFAIRSARSSAALLVKAARVTLRSARRRDAANKRQVLQEQRTARMERRERGERKGKGKGGRQGPGQKPHGHLLCFSSGGRAPRGKPSWRALRGSILCMLFYVGFSLFGGVRQRQAEAGLLCVGTFGGRVIWPESVLCLSSFSRRGPCGETTAFAVHVWRAGPAG